LVFRRILKTLYKILIVAVVLVLIGIGVRPLIFRSEETGPVNVEVVSEDGLLKLTMMLEKTRFTTSPREPVKINLTLTNIGDEEITLTFHYKTKFDFMILDYGQGAYAYRWSYDHIQGPSGWSADPSAYPTSITLEPAEMDTFVLRPGEKISQILTWNQLFDGSASAGGWYQTELAPKGKYRIEGFAGLGRWDDPWTPDNPLRFFEYVTSSGTLVSTVLETPGIDVALV